MSDAHDVLIVGAGPVGLTLACDLQRRGIRCRVVDGAQHLAQQTKAVGIQARTLELLAKMGIAGTAIARGLTTSLFSIYSDGKRLIRIDFQEHLRGSPYPYVLMLPQNETEEILTEHAHSLGTSVEWQTELIGLTQVEHGVEAVLRRPDGDEHVQVASLVGCDGAHSTVRHLLGLQFVGTTVEQSFASFAVGNVRLTWDLSYEEVFAFLHRGNFIGYFPMANGRHRVVIAYAPDEAPAGDVTLDEIRRAIQTCGPAGTRASEPADLTRFHINQRRTEHYQVSRVFLAGDAAHIHSPIGAQGMNTGIQDALNLGWKLALAVKGHASARLLESFALERQRVGEDLLRATDLTTHLALTRNPLLLALRDTLTPALFASLPVAAHRLAESLAEMNVAYPYSPITVDERQHKRALRAGDRAPDALVQTGARAEPQSLFGMFNSPRSILLVFPGKSDLAAVERQWQDIVALLSAGYQEMIEAHLVTEVLAAGTAGLHQHYAAEQGALVLVRPDGYIGYWGHFGATGPLRSYLQALFVPGEAGYPQSVSV